VGGHCLRPLLGQGRRGSRRVGMWAAPSRHAPSSAALRARPGAGPQPGASTRWTRMGSGLAAGMRWGSPARSGASEATRWGDLGTCGDSFSLFWRGPRRLRGGALGKIVRPHNTPHTRHYPAAPAACTWQREATVAAVECGSRIIVGWEAQSWAWLFACGTCGKNWQRFDKRLV
jgi:hypothetical protein